MNNKLLPCLLAASLAAVALPAAAQSAGDWTIGIGVHQVDPKSDNLRVAGVGTIEVDSGTSLGLTVTYMATDHVGVELLAAVPCPRARPWRRAVACVLVALRTARACLVRAAARTAHRRLPAWPAPRTCAARWWPARAGAAGRAPPRRA